MMKFLYQSGLWIYRAGIHIAAMAGHVKARQWTEGRRNWENKLEGFAKNSSRSYWFHCSSLGEFEQGRPVIEALRKKEPGSKIVVTFFSPSGYEVRKKYSVADCVLYLPEDSPAHARKFIELIQPTQVFFIKYDYWYFYLHELSRQKIPVYFLSAIFRPSQWFFKWYGNFFRKMLRTVTCFFVQDEQSAGLLKSIGINNCIVSGDTRFDRVAEIAKSVVALPLLDEFIGGPGKSLVMVAGSTWEEDEDLLLRAFSNSNLDGLKLVIAPHEVTSSHLENLQKKLSRQFKESEIAYYTVASAAEAKAARVLVIDTIGILSSVYHYGSMAYVGGGFGKGIHNILEAAVYGIPVFIGPEYSRFHEAVELIKRKGAFCVNDSDALSGFIQNFLDDESSRRSAGMIGKEYVLQNVGATEKIVGMIGTNL